MPASSGSSATSSSPPSSSIMASLVKTTGDGFHRDFRQPRRGRSMQHRHPAEHRRPQRIAVRRHHWIEYRIGVNLGDVIIEPDDIYGDGVNIATRLEGIAEPGQVYISGGIYEQIKHKVVCGYESLGDRKVKNITDPVRVYRVLPDADAFGNTRKRRENILIFLAGHHAAGDCRRRALVSAAATARQGRRAGRHHGFVRPHRRSAPALRAISAAAVQPSPPQHRHPAGSAPGASPPPPSLRCRTSSAAASAAAPAAPHQRLRRSASRK